MRREKERTKVLCKENALKCHFEFHKKQFSLTKTRQKPLKITKGQRDTSAKIHWKCKVIMDEKTKAMLYVRWQRLCPPAAADDPERETKAVITAFWIHYSRRKWHTAILDVLFNLNKVLLMKSRSQTAHLRRICLTIRRESFCVLSLSLLIVGCGLFKDAPAVNLWEDKLNGNNKPLCSPSPIFEEIYY